MKHSNRIWALGYALATATLLSGCATHYTKVNFCWTTTHRLSPQERFIHLPADAEQVVASLREWVSENGGAITAEDKPDKMIRPAGDADRLFQEMTAIVTNEWRAYDLNRYRNFAEGEWERMKDLSEKQVEESDLLGRAYRISAVLGIRTDSTTVSVPVGNTTMPVYTPGFLTVPGSMLYIPTTKYENRLKTVTFESRMQFYVFETSKNSCTVYVYGAPADKQADIVAHYGASTGHRWWPNVTGEHEARLAREAFRYLSRVFAGTQLSN
jgi:hypothetical protein